MPPHRAMLPGAEKSGPATGACRVIPASPSSTGSTAPLPPHATQSIRPSALAARPPGFRQPPPRSTEESASSAAGSMTASFPLPAGSV
ncbi:hypothetical protein PSR1_02827 [Anaeromyxobacter sp. PSR-1]|nr:hypothetical protein PSR1_02827 [Anaeromyxobacter sp. PSR-1]